MRKKRHNYHRWLHGDVCLSCGVGRVRGCGTVMYYKDGEKIGYESPNCKRKKRQDASSFIKSYVKLFRPDYEPVEPVEENRLEIWEVCCEVFGCRRILNRQEKLFGNKCAKHAQEKMMNAAQFKRLKFDDIFKKVLERQIELSTP